ncbi:unnamed protein product [Arctogadus glacialis]
MNELNTLCTKLGVPCFKDKEYQFLHEYCTAMKPLTAALDILQGDCPYETLLPTLEVLIQKTLAVKDAFSRMTAGLPNAIVQAETEETYSAEKEVMDYLRQPHQRSTVTSAQSVQQHQTELIKRAEENAHAFLDKELKKLWRDLFSDYPQCSESQREEDEVDGKNKEQRRCAIAGVVDITKLCLMEMNQEELADTLWRSKRLLF